MINVAIIGGSGYSGKELIRLLLSHPEVKIRSIFAKASVGRKLSDIYPLFKNRSDLVFENFSTEKIDKIDLIFLALPHGESMQIVPEIVPSGKCIIDLGGDFRFSDTKIYEKWYGLRHTAENINKNFVYGLPELFKDEIVYSKLIANPGCYPTSAILAMAPIIDKDFISKEPIIINSLSGVSGAGRKASVDLIFCEVNETVKAYKVGTHQHTPEIKYILEKISKTELDLIFIPHLIPVNRGIYSTIYIKINRKIKIESIKEFYKIFYHDKPFVRMVDTVPQLQDVVYTNYCDININYLEESNTIVIISTIDNLIKGAAGQAIQNMNLIFNFKEDLGLNGI